MEVMTADEIQRLLATARFGHVALAKAGTAYALPVFFAYDAKDCYFRSRPGRKDEFIRATVEACLVVTMVDSSDRWQSVMLVGPVEKVSKEADVLKAEDALMAVPLPPEWGVDGGGAPRRADGTAYIWRLRVKGITSVVG